LEQTAIAAPIDRKKIFKTLKPMISDKKKAQLQSSNEFYYKFHVCRGDLEPAGQTTLI
jgi:hypothetical protein